MVFYSTTPPPPVQMTTPLYPVKKPTVIQPPQVTKTITKVPPVTPCQQKQPPTLKDDIDFTKPAPLHYYRNPHRRAYAAAIYREHENQIKQQQHYLENNLRILYQAATLPDFTISYAKFFKLNLERQRQTMEDSIRYIESLQKEIVYLPTGDGNYEDLFNDDDLIDIDENSSTSNNENPPPPPNTTESETTTFLPPLPRKSTSKDEKISTEEPPTSIDDLLSKIDKQISS